MCVRARAGHKRQFTVLFKDANSVQLSGCDQNRRRCVAGRTAAFSRGNLGLECAIWVIENASECKAASPFDFNCSVRPSIGGNIVFGRMANMSFRHRAATVAEFANRPLDPPALTAPRRRRGRMRKCKLSVPSSLLVTLRNQSWSSL